MVQLYKGKGYNFTKVTDSQAVYQQNKIPSKEEGFSKKLLKLKTYMNLRNYYESWMQYLKLQELMSCHRHKGSFETNLMTFGFA